MICEHSNRLEQGSLLFDERWLVHGQWLVQSFIDGWMGRQGATPTGNQEEGIRSVMSATSQR